MQFVGRPFDVESDCRAIGAVPLCAPALVVLSPDQVVHQFEISAAESAALAPPSAA
jgi:hypothetical protein